MSIYFAGCIFKDILQRQRINEYIVSNLILPTPWEFIFGIVGGDNTFILFF